MATIAAGRIAFWEGGGLWVFDVPPGATAPTRNAMHAHHAFQPTFSVGGVFSLHFEDLVIQGPFAIVAPDTPHAFEAQGLVVLLFIEPESAAGRSLLQSMQGQPAVAMTADQARDAPSLFKQAFEHPTDPRSALRETGIQVANRIAGHAPRTAEPDRRVRQIIKWASDNLDAALTINEAARNVGLSPSRAATFLWRRRGCHFAPICSGFA